MLPDFQTTAHAALSRRFSVAPMMDRTDSCNFSLFIKKLQNQKNLL